MANFFSPALLCITITFLVFGKCISVGKFFGQGDTFYYFGYGSNLVERRLHRSCPSAVRAGIGRLNNYRLAFDGYSSRWNGAGATIEPSPGNHLWGAIWKISRKELPILDEQESVYFRLVVPVVKQYGIIKKCLTYQIQDVYKNASNPLPSKVYLNTIIRGANESNLPQYYQKYLQTIPTNGYDGPVDYEM